MLELTEEEKEELNQRGKDRINLYQIKSSDTEVIKELKIGCKKMENLKNLKVMKRYHERYEWYLRAQNFIK